MILSSVGLAEEVAADVDQQAPPAEARSVADLNRWNDARAVLRRDQLAKRLRAIKEPARLRCLDADFLAASREGDRPRVRVRILLAHERKRMREPSDPCAFQPQALER